MDKYLKRNCKKEYNKLNDSSIDYNAFEKGFAACLESKKYSLPMDETINKFMAISNVYALTHQDGWSIKELREFIRSKWDKVENPKEKEV